MAYVTELYSSIYISCDWFRSTSKKTQWKTQFPTKNTVRMAGFVLKVIFFNLTSRLNDKNQEPTAIGTKLASAYACIFMDEVKSGITTFPLAPSYWRYIFYMDVRRKKLIQFLNELNKGWYTYEVHFEGSWG